MINKLYKIKIMNNIRVICKMKNQWKNKYKNLIKSCLVLKILKGKI